MKTLTTIEEAKRQLKQELPGVHINISGEGPYHVWMYLPGTPKEVYAVARTPDGLVVIALSRWRNWNGESELHLAALAAGSCDAKRAKAERFRRLTMTSEN